MRREMNTFQSEGKVLRCPLQDKLFPSGSLGELFGGQSPTSWLPGAAGLHQSRAATAFCVGSFPPRASSNEFTITLLTSRFP